MTIHVSADTGDRRVAAARAEGVSVEILVERLLAEREGFAAIVARAEARGRPLSREDLQAKIEQRFIESERGEAIDGEKFAAAMIRELDEMEHKRREE